jgi:hypothetical protein
VSVRVELHVIVEGDGPAERSIRASIAELDAHPYTSAYHETIAQILMFDARLHWRDADRFRKLEHQQAERLARRKARSSGQPAP